MTSFEIDGKRVAQITLPDQKSDDWHASLRLGHKELRAGDIINVWIPGRGFVEIRLEMRWDDESPWCWYIAYPADLANICPVGLWCAVDD